MRRSSASIVANPVLVGAVTTLVIVVAVFLAYNANNGLPFVPTRTLTVNVPNGALLVKGNEVRVGGFRVGVVEDMIPARLPGGQIGAKAKLKLDRKVGAVPVDSAVNIRPRSALGLKYVELTRGSARKVVPEGGTLSARNATVPIELDDVYNTFDEPTRTASGENLVGFGDAFSFRGSSINRLIAGAPVLFGLLEPVARNLVDRRTHLTRFFSELGDAARVIAPISRQQARLFTTMANTFEAFSRDPKALRDTIAKTPPTLRVGTRSLRAQRPFLRDTVAFSRDLQAAARDLRPTLPVINSALETGTPILRRTVALDERLQGAMGALFDLARAPSTNNALRGLTTTVGTLQPQLRYLGPYITVCNSWNFFWTLAAEHLSAPAATGTAQRAMLNTAGQQDDSIGAMGATAPAAGKNVKSGSPQYLHGNFYSRAVDSQGRADCEAGQQGYIYGGSNQYAVGKFKTDPDYQRVVTDSQHGPETALGTLSGPTFRKLLPDGSGQGLNRDTVPEGQTFTPDAGGIGPKLDTP